MFQEIRTIQRGGRSIEKRSSFDVRANDDTSGFSGYASTWWVVDSYGTVMAPGSFTKSIRERIHKIPTLFNHNPDIPVGKHLDMREDERGLFVNVGIADDGAEGTTLLRRLRYGIPLAMSFGFQRIKSRPATEDDPLDFTYQPGASWEDVIVYTENAIWEDSVVTFPANEDATIEAIRSAGLEQSAAEITSLIEHIRSGTLTSEHDALIAELVAAYQQRSEPKPDPDAGTTPLDPPMARHRNRYAELALIEIGLVGLE